MLNTRQPLIQGSAHLAFGLGDDLPAVATGKDTAADLAAAGADTVLPDLTDTPGVLAAIYG